MENRKYSCSDVNMLVCCNTIGTSFLDNISELSAIRTNWSEDYARDLLARASQYIAQDLGLDPKKTLRNTTIEVNAIHEKALRDISFLKSQIDVDFANNPAMRAEYLRTLGFTAHLTKIQRNNHVALVSFLQTFSQNLTPEIRAAITNKGTSSQLLDRIVEYAAPFTTSELAKDSLKSLSKELPASTVVKFNAFYTEVIGICKIASKYYIDNPIKKEQFTFSSVLKKSNTSGSDTTTAEKSASKTTPKAS